MFSTPVSFMQARTSADDNSGWKVLVFVEGTGFAKDHSSILLSLV